MLWERLVECVKEAESDETIIQIERKYAQALCEQHEMECKQLNEMELVLDDMRRELIKITRLTG